MLAPMQALIPRIREGETIPDGLSYKIIGGSLWLNYAKGPELWRLQFRWTWPWLRGEYWHHTGG